MDISILCLQTQDRQLRAKTEAYERDAMREAIRATSEVRREVTPRVEQKVDYSTIDTATQKAEAVLNTHRYTVILSVGLLGSSGGLLC